jgi:plastocyanin
MKLHLYSFTLGALLLSPPQIFAQQLHKLQIDDTGTVVKQHQEHHVKVGHRVTWLRKSSAKNSWYVKFDDSPCAEGKEFGSDRSKTCTIKVACHAQGDAGCRAYSYNSATGATASMSDPHVVVDP